MREMYIQTCSVCHNLANVGKDSKRIMGLTTCYFCGNKVTTGRLTEFNQLHLQADYDQRLTIVTFVYGGVHVRVYDGDDYDGGYVSNNELHVLPDNLLKAIEKYSKH